jgi:hypothetical protein
VPLSISTLSRQGLSVVRAVIGSTATLAAFLSAAATYMTSRIISSTSATDDFLHLFIIDGLKDEKIGIFFGHSSLQFA